MRFYTVEKLMNSRFRCLERKVRYLFFNRSYISFPNANDKFCRPAFDTGNGCRPIENEYPRVFSSILKRSGNLKEPNLYLQPQVESLFEIAGDELIHIIKERCSSKALARISYTCDGNSLLKFFDRSLVIDFDKISTN